jgi:phosphatidylglycerophosphatase A
MGEYVTRKKWDTNTLSNRPKPSYFLKSPILFFAFGMGSGLAPKAPGTAGTLVALLIWFFLADLPIEIYMVIVAIAAIFGIYLCGRAAKELGIYDHPGIVWDEFVGLWIAMIGLPVTWSSIIAGFFLFRVFDILKPWPIGWIDKNFNGGLGIMLDDIVAGIATAVTIYAVKALA